MRGGTAKKQTMSPHRYGLSPLARGNLAAVHQNRGPCGSIPACAGEPMRARPQSRPARVYPRLRGGTSRNAALFTESGGLSPLARGNPTVGASPVAAAGSIPACAGEPATAALLNHRAGVYPRLRGGTMKTADQALALMGLSPLARGNHITPGPWVAAHGSIPACAGEPFADGFCNAVVGVYPRLRGGTSLSIAQATHSRGLSPLARGNPAWRSAIARRWGSIPACAGEPVRSAVMLWV